MASTATAVVNSNNSKPTEVIESHPKAEVKRVYFPATDFLSELPITLVEQMTALTKKKFSDVVLSGNITDEQMRGLRVQYLIATISGLHKQFEKSVNERKEKAQREQYKELRAKGIDKKDAVKISGYNPDFE